MPFCYNPRGCEERKKESSRGNFETIIDALSIGLNRRFMLISVGIVESSLF